MLFFFSGVRAGALLSEAEESNSSINSFVNSFASSWRRCDTEEVSFADCLSFFLVSMPTKMEQKSTRLNSGAKVVLISEIAFAKADNYFTKSDKVPNLPFFRGLNGSQKGTFRRFG